MTETVLPNLSECVPHSGPMLFLDRYISWDHVRSVCECEGNVRPERRCTKNDGFLNESWFPEIMAQGVAAHYYLSGRQTDRPKPGFLVSISSYIVHFYPKMKTGDVFRVVSSLSACVHPMGSFFVRLHTKGDCIAEADMSFLISEKE